MFFFHIAFALNLIAFGLGTCMIIWARKNRDQDYGAAKVIGYLMCTLAFLGLLCSTYYATRYWVEGYFESPHMNCPAGMMRDQPMPMGRMHGGQP